MIVINIRPSPHKCGKEQFCKFIAANFVVVEGQSDVMRIGVGEHTMLLLRK